MRTWLPYVSVGVAVTLLLTLSLSLRLFAGVEAPLEDRLFLSKPIDPQIIILAIDDASLQEKGQWPWRREVFADAISAMQKNPPRVLGIDVMFAEPSRFGSADDETLRAALARANFPIVLPLEAKQLNVAGATPSASDFLEPLSLFTASQSVSVGLVNVISDADGVVRRVPFYAARKTNGSVVGHFSSVILEKAGYAPRAAEAGVARIVFSGAPESVKMFPFSRIAEKEFVATLKDKIVLIGATAPDLHDTQPTPVSYGVPMSGVEIHAQIVNMLRYGYALTPVSLGVQFLLILAIALIAATLVYRIHSPITSLSANVALGFVYLVIAALLFDEGYVYNILHIELAWILSGAFAFSYKYLVGERYKRELKHLFSKYVSPQVLHTMLDNPKAVSLGGEEREITVLFSDIRGFTTLSEAVSPKELVRILNKYFTAMTGEILKHEGVLDKYIGDAIMAFWGAPMDDTRQADHALKAARGMLARLDALNKELRAEGDPEIHIGVGIYTGPAVVGNMGSDLRFDYTAMGDTVNVASRLEGLNKEYKTEIILGESTKEKLHESYLCKALGAVAVKGRREPVKIYTVAR